MVQTHRYGYGYGGTAIGMGAGKDPAHSKVMDIVRFWYVLEHNFGHKYEYGCTVKQF